MPRWWALWLRLMWARARVTRRLTGRPPLGSLALASIGFAHWGLLERRPLPHSYLVFQSNFAGGRDAYIETFCYVIPWIMRGLWTGIYGAPDVRPVGRFQRYVAESDIPPAYYWSAYPDVSTGMVLAALERRDGERPKPGVVEGLCAIVPVRDGRLGTLMAELAALPGGGKSPFERVGETHFARFVVVPSLSDRHGRPVGRTAYLLFATEFDGSLERHLQRLEAELHEAEAIFGNCAGYDGRLGSYLLEHRVPAGYSFAGYPNATVADIRALVGAP